MPSSCMRASCPATRSPSSSTSTSAASATWSGPRTSAGGLRDIRTCPIRAGCRGPASMDRTQQQARRSRESGPELVERERKPRILLSQHQPLHIYLQYQHLRYYQLCRRYHLRRIYISDTMRGGDCSCIHTPRGWTRAAATVRCSC